MMQLQPNYNPIETTTKPQRDHKPAGRQADDSQITDGIKSQTAPTITVAGRARYRQPGENGTDDNRRRVGPISPTR